MNNIVLSSTGKLELDLTINNRIFLYDTIIPTTTTTTLAPTTTTTTLAPTTTTTTTLLTTTTTTTISPTSYLYYIVSDPWGSAEDACASGPTGPTTLYGYYDDPNSNDYFYTDPSLEEQYIFNGGGDYYKIRHNSIDYAFQCLEGGQLILALTCAITTTTTTTVAPTTISFTSNIAYYPTYWKSYYTENSGNVLHWVVKCGDTLIGTADDNNPEFTFDKACPNANFTISSSDNLVGLTRLYWYHASIIDNLDISNAISLINFDIRSNHLIESDINGVLDSLISIGNENGILKAEDQQPVISYNSTTLAKFAILTARGWTVTY